MRPVLVSVRRDTEVVTSNSGCVQSTPYPPRRKRIATVLLGIKATAASCTSTTSNFGAVG